MDTLGKKTIVVPYLENMYCRNKKNNSNQQRDIKVFFQGNDRGQSIRKSFKKLENMKGVEIIFTDIAPNQIEKYSKENLAKKMKRSLFCLVPRGDSPTTSRLYDSIACGCIPIVLSDDIGKHLAFPNRINYSSLLIQIKENDFVNDPKKYINKILKCSDTMKKK